MLDALELAFQELDSEDNITDTSNMEDVEKITETKPKAPAEDPEFEKKISVTPLYENIDIFFKNNVESTDAFPLDMPTNVLEPPKEKPPPPPMEDAQDELLGNVSPILICFMDIITLEKTHVIVSDEACRSS